jgi:hypothetical protein
LGDYRADLEVHASTNTKVKSTGTPFALTDVGRTLKILSGTGWTPGSYTITAYDGTAYVTLSASPAAVGTTGGVGVATDLPSLTNDALQSIKTYGLREATVEIEEIKDLQAAKDYATGFLNRYALPLKRGTLVLDLADVLVRFVAADTAATPQGQIAVAGAKSSIPNQNAARIVYALRPDGAVTSGDVIIVDTRPGSRCGSRPRPRRPRSRRCRRCRSRAARSPAGC